MKLETMWLNDVEVMGEAAISDENTFDVHFDVGGANNFHLFSHMFNSGTIHVKVPSLGHDFKARIVNHSSSYQNQLDHATTIHFSITYKEVLGNEEAEDDKWTVFTGLFHASIMNWVRTRAIADLLQEKGVITSEEYEERINVIRERDFEEMRKFILEGKSQDEE